MSSSVQQTFKGRENGTDTKAAAGRLASPKQFFRNFSMAFPCN